MDLFEVSRLFRLRQRGEVTVTDFQSEEAQMALTYQQYAKGFHGTGIRIGDVIRWRESDGVDAYLDMAEDLLAGVEKIVAAQRGRVEKRERLKQQIQRLTECPNKDNHGAGKYGACPCGLLL